MNNWLDISIEIKKKDLDKACDISHMVIPHGFQVEDYSDLEQVVLEMTNMNLIDDELKIMDKTICFIHIYILESQNPLEEISFLKKRFSDEGIQNNIKISNICEQDWENEWKKFYHPIEIGKNIVICPSWETYENKYNKIIVTLDPGMAFGTGGHETTRLCIEAFERYIQKGKTKFLDIGTGSGILAITAKKLGATDVCGVDIDQNSIRVAKENSLMNNIKDINFIKGNLVDDVNTIFDVICANIVADVIIEIIPNIYEVLSENGLFISSGIIETRKDNVVEFLKLNGFIPISFLEEKGWVCITSKKISKGELI
ncbi:MAG: 50S ribosomal protein L11 methyltransferase [Oscillospiraceae bacterium]|nr:50S ribosomal protein L11 methyltransferase [Oscillospiraceae bacterium]